MATHQPSHTRAWPLLRSLRGATPASLGRDVLAGLTFAAIAAPTQMATARLGGFSPELGLWAFIAAAVGFAVFGASRSLAAGADSTITPIFAGTLAALAAAGSPQYAGLSAMLAVMVGVILLAGGLLRLGWIADLLSTPVITGFLAGIAVHIVVAQAPAVMGLQEVAGPIFHRIAAIAEQVAAAQPAAMVIGLGGFAVTMILDRLSPRLPGALIVLAAATAASLTFGLERRGLAVLGPLTAQPPHPGWPAMPAGALTSLIGLAFVIALVVMMQTAATTRSTATPGEEPNVDRDFIGVGAGNLLAGLFGAFPVNASPPVSAIVHESGARSQAAALTAALAILLLALFGAPLLAHLPTSALAGVLFYVAARILRVKLFAQLWLRTKAEFALAAATAVLITALPIETGAFVGIVLSVVHGVFTTTRAQPIVFERAPGTTVWWPVTRTHPGETEPGVLVLGFQAPLSFLNAYDFRHGVLKAIRRAHGLNLFVLEASSIVEIDYTAATVLIEVIQKARDDRVDFAVARLESVRAHAAFERLGVTQALGGDHLFRTVEQAITTLKT